MKDLNKNQVGLIIGLFFAVLHIGWSLLVALGLAQVLTDWVLWLHFMNIQVRIESFEVSRAVLLTLFTFVVGYLLGFVSTWIWNMVIKKSK